MIGKGVYLLTFLASFAVFANAVPTSNIGSYAANNARVSHDLIVGARAPGDRLLFQQNVTKKSSWLQIVKDEQTFYVTNYNKITQVRALDQKTNGNGATATRVSGGPGFDRVTLGFKSIRGHGINFNVQLYGRP